MTPEELNRVTEFILQQQADFSLKLDRDHEWAKRIIGELAVSNQRIIELIASNMRRLDENDKEHRKFQHNFEKAQRRSEEFHREALARLDRILQRLADQNQRPN